MTALASLLRRSPSPDEEGELALRRNQPLVPAESIAGRALVIVIAIMTFLASLAAGGAVLVEGASQGWSRAVSDEITIQIPPVAGRDAGADVASAAALARAAPGVADVRVYSTADSERLLAPWLGDGLDLSELPIPRLIAARTSGSFDEAALRKALTQKIPTAMLDDHQGWIRRLTTMARAFVAFAVALVGLVVVAMGLAVAFATRGAMAGNREIIDVLHFVGAEDRFVTRQFERHFLRLGLRGGAIGGACAVAAFFLAGALASIWTTSPQADQARALFGSFSLGYWGYAAIAAIAAGVAVLTGAVSRTIVARRLKALA